MSEISTAKPLTKLPKEARSESYIEAPTVELQVDRQESSTTLAQLGAALEVKTKPASAPREDEVRRDRQAIALSDERLDLMQPIAVDHDQIAGGVVDDLARCLRCRRHVVLAVPEGIPDAQPASPQRRLQHDDGAQGRKGIAADSRQQEVQG